MKCNKKVCRHCKISKEHLCVDVRLGDREYYSCRKCNTTRLKKYRATKTGAKNSAKAVYKSIVKYPEKQKARLKLGIAVKCGKVKKPKGCSLCCSKIRVEGHHEDYTKPLDVVWLCRSCHLVV